MKKVVLISAVLAFSLYADEIKSLNDMTVTAQKTEESVQDIPVAINVFDDVNLEDKEINDLLDLSYFVPNFYYLSGGGANLGSPTIRGVNSDMALVSSTVGLYVDGVPISNSVGFEAIIEDIERVEVLRGPQGTLYGKNTEAGVINVITTKPTNTLEGKVGLSYGEDNKQQAEFSLRTPMIKDKLYLGLTGLYYKKDGFMKSEFLDKEKDGQKKYYGKVYLRATPTDRLELSLISTFYKPDNDGLTQNLLGMENPRVYLGNFIEKNKSKNQSHAFKVGYDFDNFNVKSVTTYNKNEMLAWQDLDFSQEKMQHAFTDATFETLSEEFNVDGEIGNLKWLVGIYTDRREENSEYEIYSSVPQMQVASGSDMVEKSFGAYTHLNYALTDKLNILGGIRYDKDKSEYYEHTYKVNLKQNSSNVSPKIALEYKINSDIMTYATIAKGYKSGGFYIYAHPDYSNQYKSESLWNYELGFKSSFLDKRLQINADIFYMDIKDKQVLSYVDVYYGFISNVPAKSYGFEIDGNYIINNNLSLFASFGYNEAKFDNFSDFKGSYKGNYLPYAPKYNYSLGTIFRGFGGFYASANLRGYGKMYLNNANTFEQNSYALVDTKIGYEWESFDIYLYANNLFDKKYDLNGFRDHYVELSEPREVGLRFTYRF